jgi:hypothetical protein
VATGIDTVVQLFERLVKSAALGLAVLAQLSTCPRLPNGCSSALASTHNWCLRASRCLQALQMIVSQRWFWKLLVTLALAKICLVG